MKAAIEVVVVPLPLSINRMFLNSSVKRGNSPEGKTQTLTLHLEKTMPIMAKISGKFPVSFLQATYLPCWRSQIYGAKRNTIGSCAVTWKFRSVQWTWEVRTGNRVYGWVQFASVLSRFACELGRFTNVLITLSDGNIS